MALSQLFLKKLGLTAAQVKAREIKLTKAEVEDGDYNDAEAKFLACIESRCDYYNNYEEDYEEDPTCCGAVILSHPSEKADILWKQVGQLIPAYSQITYIGYQGSKIIKDLKALGFKTAAKWVNYRTRSKLETVILTF